MLFKRLTLVAEWRIDLRKTQVEMEMIYLGEAISVVWTRDDDVGDDDDVEDDDGGKYLNSSAFHSLPQLI